MHKKGRRHCSPLLQAPPQTYYNSPKELIRKWDIPLFLMPSSIYLYLLISLSASFTSLEVKPLYLPLVLYPLRNAKHFPQTL